LSWNAGFFSDRAGSPMIMIAPVVSSVLTPHCVKNGHPAVHVLQFKSESATLLAVYSGRADFLVTDDAAAKYLARTAPKPITAIPNPLLPKFYLGIVVSKSERWRAFAAHVTLGRVREPRVNLRLGAALDAAEPFGRQRVARLSLMRSDLSPRGARYTELAAVPLAE